MLLGGQYLNKTRFENITSDECVSRYGARFITSGSGFGVPVASQLEAWGAHSNSSVFSSYQEKSGEIDVNIFGTTSGQKLLDCKRSLAGVTKRCSKDTDTSQIV